MRFKLVAVAAVVCVGCANETPVITAKGGCGDANGGQVCAWADAQGSHVLAAGIEIPFASIQNSKPGPGPMDWPPKPVAVDALPDAAPQQTGMTELTMYWEGMGHPPAAFMTPHFDFHFYLISDADRKAIDCKDHTKPAQLASGYDLPDEPLSPEDAKMLQVDTLVGICVPQMGMHALPHADLQSNKVFSGDIVIGYYHGKPIFIEPMISRDMLMQKKSFTLAIPAVPGLSGNHPTEFRADWNDATQSYKFVFSNFKAGA